MQLIQTAGLALPDVRHRWMRLGALVLVLLYLTTLLPGIITDARNMDGIAEQRVAPWDDTDYQMLAVNILNGYGFTETMQLPAAEYRTMREESELLHDNYYRFYRAPGFAFLLAGLYAITGVSTLAARILIGAMIWLTAVLLVGIGDRLAGWVGSLAGGLAGYFLIHVSQFMNGPDSFLLGRTLSESLTAFLITLFALFWIFFLQQKKPVFLYLSCLILAGVVLTRANFLAALPFFLLIVLFETHQWKPVLISAILLLGPVLAWSGYATYIRHSPVLISTQGSRDFPRFNNQDVITGFGPEKRDQGGWQPGFVMGADGEPILTNTNSAQEGENGWVKGFQFWLANPKKLPALFYLKLCAGLWYGEGLIYSLGIAYFLAALGFRKPRRPIRFLPSLNSGQILALQIGLCLLLFWLADLDFFGYVLLIWSLIALIAWLHPYGDAAQPLQAGMVWFIPLFAAYLVSTLLFGGEVRFHFPLDPLVILFGYGGGLLTGYYLIKRDLGLAMIYGVLVAARITQL